MKFHTHLLLLPQLFKFLQTFVLLLEKIEYQSKPKYTQSHSQSITVPFPAHSSLIPRFHCSTSMSLTSLCCLSDPSSDSNSQVIKFISGKQNSFELIMTPMSYRTNLFLLMQLFQSFQFRVVQCPLLFQRLLILLSKNKSQNDAGGSQPCPQAPPEIWGLGTRLGGSFIHWHPRNKSQNDTSGSFVSYLFLEYQRLLFLQQRGRERRREEGEKRKEEGGRGEGRRGKRKKGKGGGGKGILINGLGVMS